MLSPILCDVQKSLPGVIWSCLPAEMTPDEREYTLMIRDAHASRGCYKSDVTLLPSSGRKTSWERETNHYLHSANKSWYLHDKLQYWQPGHAISSIC